MIQNHEPLPHEEVRLPVLAGMVGKLPQEGNMVGPNGPVHQVHVCFVRRLAALDIVAAQAGAHEVFPGILSAPAFRHDVIDGERHTRRTAVLASVPIAPQNIFSRENDFLEWNPNVGRKPDHAGKGHRQRSRMNGPARHTAY